MMYVLTASEIGLALRDRRKRLKLTHKALAEKVGVSRWWVMEAERGNPGAELGHVLKALDALGLRIAIDDGTSGSSDDVPPSPDIDAIVRKARTRRP